MNTIQKIAKNTGVLFLSQLLSYLIGFFYYLFAARYLGVANFGILSFAFAFTGIFSIIMDLGLNSLMVRDIARNTSLANEYLGNIIGIKIILGVITFLIIVLIVNLLNYSQTTIQVIYIISLSIILTTFCNSFVSIFQAHEKMEYQGIGLILNSFLLLGGTFLAIYNGLGIIAFSTIYLIASIILLVYYIVISTTKFTKPRITIDLNFLPKIKEALPFGFSSLFVTIYVYIDSIMLYSMVGNEAIGLYSVAYRLIMVLLFLPGVINNAIFPVMSKLYVSNKNSLNMVMNRYFKIMLLLGIPMGVGITILANQIIILMFGVAYSGSVIALQILIWATVFTFANAAFVKLFESINRQFTITKITIIGVLVNVSLNLILIPIFSYVAASINTVITELIVLTIVFITAKRSGYDINREIIRNDIPKIIAASLIMGIFLWIFKDLNLLI